MYKYLNLSSDSKIKLFSVLNHLLVIYGITYHFSWAGVITAYILGFFITLIGISIGYHRYFTHKSFTTSPITEWVFIVIGSLAFLGPVIGWVGIHRLHHANSDTDKDPHSPKNGFLKSWLHIFSNKNVPIRYVFDLIKNPRLQKQHKYYFITITIYFTLMYIMFGIFAIYLVSLPGVYLYHVTGIVNSLHHVKSDKKYNLTNNAIDLPIFNIITAGESYHAYHHHKASSPIFGKYDPAKFVIPILQRTL